MKRIRRPIQQIHFYDTDSGFVHYTSDVFPTQPDMRVFDAARELADIDATTLQCLPDERFPQRPLTNAEQLALAVESIEIVQASFRFLNNVMTRSPIRDHEEWRQKGRAEFQRQKRTRRLTFKTQKRI